jgi:carboxypeptidase D
VGADEFGFIFKTEFKYHNFVDLEAFLKEIHETYPKLTRLYSIGKSVENRDLWVLEISTRPGVHTPLTPEFKYIANMHGNEPGMNFLVLTPTHLLICLSLDLQLVENFSFCSLNICAKVMDQTSE